MTPSIRVASSVARSRSSAIGAASRRGLRPWRAASRSGRVTSRAGLDPRVDPGVVGKRHDREGSGARLVAAPRVLGTDPRLDGMALRPTGCVEHARRRRPPGGPSTRRGRSPHGLGDRVLDLEARVDLEEGDRVGGARRRGTRRCPPSGTRPTPRAVAPSQQARAHPVGKAGCGRFLEHLLVSPLRRAVPIAEGEDSAGSVARRPAPRHGGPRPANARGTPARRRTRRRPDGGRLERARPARVGSWQTRMPMPPPPAVALITSG